MASLNDYWNGLKQASSLGNVDFTKPVNPNINNQTGSLDTGALAQQMLNALKTPQNPASLDFLSKIFSKQTPGNAPANLPANPNIQATPQTNAIPPANYYTGTNTTTDVDYDTMTDDDILAELESMLTGSMNGDYKADLTGIEGRIKTPNLIADLDAIKKAFTTYQEDPELKRLTGEYETLGRSLATNQANRVPVLNELEKQLAEKYGNYQNLIKQRADAVTNALSARGDATAQIVGSQTGDFKLTDGTISPQALQGADIKAREKIASAQALTDTLSTLLGKPKEQVALGLQAYEDQLAGQSSLQNTLQNLLGRKDALFNTEMSILGQYPQYRQQEYSNQVASRTDALNEAYKKSEDAYNQNVNKITLAQSIKDYANADDNGKALDNYLRNSFLNYDNAVASSFAEPPMIITNKSLATVQEAGLDDITKQQLNSAKTLLATKNFFQLTPEEKSQLTTLEATLKTKGQSAVIPYYQEPDYLTQLTSFGLTQGVKKEDLSKISSELLSGMQDIAKQQTKAEAEALKQQEAKSDTFHKKIGYYGDTVVPGFNTVVTQVESKVKEQGGKFKEDIPISQQIRIYLPSPELESFYKTSIDALYGENGKYKNQFTNRFKSSLSGTDDGVDYVVWDMQTINDEKELQELYDFKNFLNNYTNRAKAQIKTS